MTAWCRVSLFCSILFLFPSTKAVENLLAESNSSNSDVMKKILKKCIVEYSLTCFKLDLLTVLHQLNFKSTFHLTSGITLIRIPLEDEQSEDLPRELLTDLAQNNFSDDNSLDIHLFKKIGNYLRSINLSFPLINDYYLSKMNKYFGITSVSNEVDNAITGRKKVKAVWIKWLVSITYAVAFGLLIGLVSKSFLLSIIALCLTLSSRFGNNAFGSPSGVRNNYEIIAHPLPQVQHLNTHSSEVKYEEDNSLSSSRPGIAYVYPRTMPHVEKVLAFHHLANLHKNYYSDNPSDVIGYKGYIAEKPVK